MQTLAATLERFNRKERNLLVRDALGHRQTRLLLSTDYCSRIGTEIGFEFEPSSAWWATDYHINWLAGALAIHALGDGALSRIWENDDPEGPQLIEGNQEDVDLVIAVENRLIFVEAKAYGRFTETQIRSKLERLTLLRSFFRNLPGAADRAVEFHFLLTSPIQPSGLEDEWTPWLNVRGTIPWIKLEIDGSIEVLTVTRCDEAGLPTASKRHWRVRHSPRVTSSPAIPIEDKSSMPT